MVTRVLHECGLHLLGAADEVLIDAAEDNPEGFWENKAIVACNDELLEATGGAWDNPPDLPPQGIDDPRVTQLKESARAAVAALSEREPWGFKDPRTCLTAAYWLDLCPDLRFIICVRHPLEVALSLKRRNQNSYSLGLRLWERYYSAVLDLVPAERRIVTHYDTFFVDPEGEVARLCAFAGLAPRPPRVRTDLRHHTIDVSLNDAGVSENARDLYVRLCREAGAAAPHEPPSDEGRVRRLVLDGAVAERHAEQRKAAIGRLEEREEQLRTRIRELEQQLIRDRGRALQIDRRLADIEPGPIGKAIHRFTKRVERGLVKVVIRPGKRAIQDASKSAIVEARQGVDKLPQPTQQQLRRTRQVIVRARRDPLPTVKRLGAKSTPKARAAAKRYLPPSARKSLVRANGIYRRARREPVTTARRYARKLPAPVQTPLRRTSRLVTRSRPGQKRATDSSRRRSPVPRGPAFRRWKASYEEIVKATVPLNEQWLMIAPGSPKRARNVLPHEAELFPTAHRSEPLPDDLSQIAHLESLRCRGYRYLVLPEGSRAWFATRGEFRDYVTRHYRTVVDRPGAGAAFALFENASNSATSLRAAVNGLTGEQLESPTVLDWTSFEIADAIPEVTTFRSPRDGSLPYIDHTIDVVVVDETRDLDEAFRVASYGVVVASERGSTIDVRGVHRNGQRPAPPERVLICSTNDGDNTEWRQCLAEVAAASNADTRFFDTAELSHLAVNDDYAAVVILEPFVLPLPGAIQRAADLVAARPDRAHAAKILRNDGRIEAAGASVFFDRSVALIAYGSDDVRAPWHEYARFVCWSPGMVAAAPALLHSARVSGRREMRAFLREWCAAVWASGGSVQYQPSLAAVRGRGDGQEPSNPLPESAWQRVLDLRPRRPATLDDSAWRKLLAADDVEACRGEVIG